jgi:hypothetical protein
MPISNELWVLPNIDQSLSQGLQHHRKTNHEDHKEHEEKNNLCVPGGLRGSKSGARKELYFHLHRQLCDCIIRTF